MFRRHPSYPVAWHFLGFWLFLFTLAVLFSFVALHSTLPVFTGKASAQGTVSLTLVQSNASTAGGGPSFTVNTRGVFGGGTAPRRSSDGFLVYYEVIPSPIIFSTSVRTAETRQIMVLNHQPLTIPLDLSTNLPRLTLHQSSLVLQPNDEAFFEFTFTAHDPGVYTGFILVDSDFDTKQVPVVARVHTREPSFSATLTIPDEFFVLPSYSDALPVHIDLEKFDGGFVELHYLLKDAHNNELFRITETTPIRERLSFDKTLPLPTDLPSGSYVIGLEVYYKGEVVVDADVITLLAPHEIRSEQPLDIVFTRTDALFTLAILFCIILALYRHAIKKSHF